MQTGLFLVAPPRAMEIICFSIQTSQLKI